MNEISAERDQTVAQARGQWELWGRDPSDWFYKINWLAHQTSGSKSPTLGGRWLLFMDHLGVGRLLKREFLKANCDVVEVYVGDRYQKLGDSSFQINPIERLDFLRLFNEQDSQAIEGVCYLWGCSRYNPLQDSYNELNRSLKKSLYGLLYLSQSLMAIHGGNDVRLLITTLDAQQPTGIEGINVKSTVNPVGASLWGFAKSLDMECRFLQVHCIDIDLLEIEKTSLAHRLLSEFGELRPPVDRFAVYRHGERYIQRVEQLDLDKYLPRKITPQQTPGFVKGGVYLIAGGLGGVGLAVAEYLAKHYQATLLLISRRRLPPSAQWQAVIDSKQSDLVKLIKRIQALQAYGGKLHVIDADITDEQAMGGMQQWLLSRFKGLDGVIHAAGVLSDKRLKDMNTSILDSVLAPKIRGSYLLSKYTRPLKPSVFVFCTSLVGVTGNAGQANHAAANSFEDAFGHYLRGLGQKVLVINWGFWGQAGVVADQVYKRLLARQQVFPMDTRNALTALEKAMRLPLNQVVIANLGSGGLGGYDKAHDLGEVSHDCRTPKITRDHEVLLRNYHDLEMQINRWAGVHILQTFQNHGLFQDDSDKLDLQAVLDRLQVIPRYTRLLQRYLDILLEDNLLSFKDGQYAYQANVGLPDPSLDAACIIDRYPISNSALKVLTRCIPALCDVVSGLRHPITVLFDRGSVAQLEDIYENFPVMRLANAVLNAGLLRILTQHKGSRFNVLEVGSGTGGLSAYVIPAISGKAKIKYWCTDVGSSFVAHIRSKFKNYPFVTACAFDICKDPGLQAISGLKFDCIIAANVFHATPDLRNVVRNLRQILSDSGYMLFVETVRPNRYADCTVGMLDAWWGFTDTGMRPDYPLLSSHQWQVLMRQEGFEVSTVPVVYKNLVVESDFAVVVARLGQNERALGRTPAEHARQRHAQSGNGKQSHGVRQ